MKNPKPYLMDNLINSPFTISSYCLCSEIFLKRFDSRFFSDGEFYSNYSIKWDFLFACSKVTLHFF